MAQSSTDPTALQNQKTLLQLQIDVATLQNQLAALQAAPAVPTLTDQLTTAKNIADLKSAITTDQVAQIKTAIGSIDTSKLPGGTATLTNVDIQPTILGYDALQTALNSITLESCKPGATIVLGPGALDDINVLQAYQTMVGQVSKKLEKYKTVPTYDGTHVQAEILPAAIFAGIDAAVALTSLFKSDVTMSGADFTADAVAARFIMAHVLTSGNPISPGGTTRPKCAVIDANDFIGPALNPSPFASLVNTLDTDVDAATVTENTIKTVNIPAYTKAVSDAQAIEAKAKALSDEIAASNKKLSDPKVTAKEKTTLNKTVSDDTKALAALDAAQAKTDEDSNTTKLKSANSDVAIIDSLTAAGAKLITTLNTVDSSGSPYLARIMKAEAVSNKTHGLAVLTLSVSKIGGNSITRKNIFRTAIQFGGGVVVQFQLKGSDGLTVLESGQATGYTVKNEKAKTIAQWPAPEPKTKP